jgi:ATP-dependent Lon protease
LEEKDVESRLSLALNLLANEKNIAQLQKEINKQVDAKLTKQQREYFLKEQMKSIKQELGLEKDDKSEFLKQVNEKLAAYGKIANPPNNFQKVLSVLKQQVDKLSSLDQQSPGVSTRQVMYLLLS